MTTLTKPRGAQTADAVSAEVLNQSPEYGAPITIMGVSLDSVSTQQTLDIIEKMIASKAPHYLATANVDFLVQAQTDAELRGILAEAHLVLCDGTPLIWASKWLGNPLPERVAGSDLVPLILQLAARRGYRVFLLGAAEEKNRTAAENIARDYPGLQVAGRYSPPLAPLDKMDHADIRRRIQETRADIVLVAFGCPKQEKWISRNYRDLGVPVCVGVGATIDFLAGAVKRAPVWMRKCGMEWTWRLLMEPRRLATRYAKGFFVFGFGLCRQLLHTGFRRKGQTGTSAPAQSGELPVWLTMPESLDASAVAELRSTGTSFPSNRLVTVDMAPTRFIDSTGVGFLIRLRRVCFEKGSRLALANASQRVKGLLAMMKLEGLFEFVEEVQAGSRGIAA